MPGHFPACDVKMVSSILKSPRIIFTKDISLRETNNKADSILLRFKNWGHSVHNLAALGQDAEASMSVRLCLNKLMRKTLLSKFLCGFLTTKILPKDFKLASDHFLNIRQDDHEYIVNRIEVPLVDLCLAVANLAEVDLDNVRSKS